MDSTQQFPPEFRPHFDGLAQGRIQLPHCTSCGRFHWYPMPLCPHCQASGIAWKPVHGRGRLYSWTTVRHAFTPALKEQVPYIVALVTFDDAPGVRLVTNLVDAASRDLRCEMPLEPVFEYHAGALPQVKFRPAKV